MGKTRLQNFNIKIALWVKAGYKILISKLHYG